MKFDIGELLTDSAGNQCYIVEKEKKYSLLKTTTFDTIHVVFMKDKFFIYDKHTGHAFNAVYTGDRGWFSLKDLKEYIKHGIIKRYKVI